MKKATMSYFSTLYQEFIYLSRYSRFIWTSNRREQWTETVSRYFDFFTKHLKENQQFELDDASRAELEDAVLSLQVMPSMRCLMTAGDALERDHIAGYNCSYIEISRPQAFDELLFVLMSGTGVGFSVERDKICHLPTVAEDFHPTDTTLVVADSKLGWAKAFRELIGLLYSGQIPRWDLSKLRPAGAPLKTMGGRSSGPDPLDSLFKYAVSTFKGAAGRKLNSLECHDLVCKIGEVVVVGGVRRSALISLSNVSDDRLRHAKSGQWWIQHPERTLANNSACYTEKPDVGVFMDEWKALYESKSGERGIFNRAAAKVKVASNARRIDTFDFGINPCGEIVLRDREFCNLSEVVARHDDTLESLFRKVRLAAILGTFQASLTNFKYVSAKWKQNCEEEALLGVSLTGIMDCPLLNTHSPETAKLLEDLKSVAIETNKTWSKKLGIAQGTAVTCVKPSGTISQLVDSSSGIHARHAEYYIRTVRMDRKDPLTAMMVEKKFPHEEDVTNPHALVFSFPTKAPAADAGRTLSTAIEQLNFWLLYKNHWCEHNPSVTISVKEHEWLAVGAWVYEHFDQMCGVSFLPYSDHTYRQAPYQECSEADYIEFVKKMPTAIDWTELSQWEHDDQTTGTQTLACSAGGCDL